MGDKKGPARKPDVWKVSPPQHLTVCLCLRDRFGMPLHGIRIQASQNARPLKTEGARDSTDEAGRVVFTDVSSGALSIAIADDAIPLDQKDVRAGKPQRYKYVPFAAVEPLQIQVRQSGDSLPFIEQTRAYVTIFCDATPWVPRFRFPWQNPLHRAPGGFYEKREIALRYILAQLGVTDAAAWTHDALVKKLIDLYLAHAAFGGGIASPGVPVAPQTGGASGATGERDETEESPSPKPAPEHVKAASTGVTVHIAPVAPPPPPPAPPPLASSPGALPSWVWYMLFHYSGIRYKSAHGSYIDPGHLLELLRKDQIDASWPSKPPSEPNPVDVTEAFAIVASSTTCAAYSISDAAAHAYQADLADSKAGTVFNALRKLHRWIAENGRKFVSKRADVQAGINGDHYALGLLAALKLRAVLSETDVKAVQAFTSWRNDLTAGDGAMSTSLAGAFSGPVRKGLGQFVADSWKKRAYATLDLLTTSVVCNQASEIAEHARGYEHVQLIGGNAAVASHAAPLFPLTKSNWGRVQRGMHLFFYGYRAPSPNDQPYPNATVVAEGWIVSRTESAAQAVALESLPKLTTHTYGSLVDPKLPLNIYETKHPKADAENGNLMERSDLDGIYRVDAKGFTGFEYSSDYKAVKDWTAVVRIHVVTVQALDEAGKPKFQPNPSDSKQKKLVPVLIDLRRVGILKWFHEEIVIDLRKGNVYTFSTSAPNAVGVKVHRLEDQLSILVGGAHADERKQSQLDFYLNTALLGAGS